MLYLHGTRRGNSLVVTPEGVARSMGILPMSITGVSPVQAGPRWPCDSWAGCPCYEDEPRNRWTISARPFGAGARQFWRRRRGGRVVGRLGTFRGVFRRGSSGPPTLPRASRPDPPNPGHHRRSPRRRRRPPPLGTSQRSAVPLARSPAKSQPAAMYV